jgi:hypothetical protein
MIDACFDVPLSRCLVFVFFANGCMAVSVAHFVALEAVSVIDAIFGAGFLAAGRIGAVVTVFGMEVVIDVALEVIGTMKPLTGSDEDTAVEPLWPVIAIGSAVIGRSIVVAVGTIRGSDADDNLGLRCGGYGGESKTSNNS